MKPMKAGTALLAALALAPFARVAWADQQGATDRTRTGRHVAESRIYFSFDSDELSRAACTELDAAAQWIQENRAGVILIEGHTDKVGSEAYNKDLGERRAEVAKQYLVAHGVPAARIRILSYGEGLPAAETGERARPNRRIVLFAVQKEPIIEKRTEVVEVPVAAPAAPVAPVERRPLGVQLMVGGGAINSLDQGTEDFVELGTTWNARVALLNRSLIGFEAAYVGSVQSVDALGLDTNAQLLGNGVEGDVRLNLLRAMPVRPYLFAGLGWTHYDIGNSDVETSLVDGEDDVLHVPAGLGVDFRLYRGLTLDLRGTMRAAFDDNMFDRASAEEEAGMENWAASADLGFEF
jgi:outer membrane protein OmpA-like peptidoglycan-associated protein